MIHNLHAQEQCLIRIVHTSQNYPALQVIQGDLSCKPRFVILFSPAMYDNACNYKINTEWMINPSYIAKV